MEDLKKNEKRDYQADLQMRQLPLLRMIRTYVKRLIG